MGRSAANAERAKLVEEKLRSQGKHYEADQIKRLRKALAGATGTLKILHRDNMKLRKKLGLQSFLDEKTQSWEDMVE